MVDAGSPDPRAAHEYIEFLRAQQHVRLQGTMATPTVPDVNCPCGSAEKFSNCHGRKDPIPLVPPAMPALGRGPVIRKLDLACGQTPREGFEGVDIWEGAQHRVNLMTYPWPFDDNSVAELHCSHFIEHIPMIHVDAFGAPIPYPEGMATGQDALLRFFDECYRILAPNGAMKVHWPALRSNRAFWDPTHRRFIPEETMLYLNRDWRAMNRLDHYKANCNFAVNVGHTFDKALGVRTPEIQREMIYHRWNHVVDLVADLVAMK